MSFTRKLVTREGFLTMVIASVGGVATVVAGVPIIGVVLSPLIRGERHVWRDVGAVTDFKVNDFKQVNFAYPDQLPWAGATKFTAAWLKRTHNDSFTAFAVYCTHLGCPVHWVPDPQLFLCPCHGSVFYGDGTVAGGPAPRPLFVYQTRVRNGRVEVRTEPQPTVGFTSA